MSLVNILVIIIVLHLVAGFGYIFYKLEFQGKKKIKDTDKSQENKNE